MREQWLQQQVDAARAMEQMSPFLQAVIDAGGLPIGQSAEAKGIERALRGLDISMKRATRGKGIRGVFNPQAPTVEELVERLRVAGHEVESVEDLLSRTEEGVWEESELTPENVPFARREAVSAPAFYQAALAEAARRTDAAPPSRRSRHAWE